MKTRRHKTRRITVGGVAVGGGAPVVVQSMTKTRTEDVRATAAQIKRLAAAGCELVRVAVPDKRSLKAFGLIKEKSPLPVIADVHYSAELAIGALEAGADCVRVNPGNLGGRGEFRRVALAARNPGRAVRIGVNAGSIEASLKRNSRLSITGKMVESALRYIETAEKVKLRDYKISLKAFDVSQTIDSYRKISKLTDAPLHIGITESGDVFHGAIRSAVGIGILLAEGIGDTLRVSLTGPAEREVQAAWEILRALDIRRRGVEIVSCPACARSGAGIEKIAAEVRKKTEMIEIPLRVAVMGCEVNGPGESEGADAALVLDRAGRAAIYVGGVFSRKVPAARAAAVLIAELNSLIDER